MIKKVQSLYEEAQKRFVICEGCEHFSAATSVCQQCSCIMRLKVFFPGSNCPIDKWDAVEEQTEKEVA
jgi:hypothetical protein